MVGGTTPPQSDSGEISRVLVLNLLWRKSGARAPRPGYFCLDNAFALIEGGTIPPQSDSGEISRVLVLNLLWRKSGAHAPPRIFLSRQRLRSYRGAPGSQGINTGSPRGAPYCLLKFRMMASLVWRRTDLFPSAG